VSCQDEGLRSSEASPAGRWDGQRFRA